MNTALKIKHNHKCKLAFGKPTKTIGDCPRCDELREGAEPRKGWSTNKQNNGTWEDMKKSYCFKCAPWVLHCPHGKTPYTE